jgi:hypothetical protein
MRIRLLRNVVDEGRAYDAGDVVEVPEVTAERLIGRGAAKVVGSSAVERAVVVATRRATTGPQADEQVAGGRQQAAGRSG